MAEDDWKIEILLCRNNEGNYSKPNFNTELIKFNGIISFNLSWANRVNTELSWFGFFQKNKHATELNTDTCSGYYCKSKLWGA